MANIRDRDNFEDPRQFIEEQLLVRDYSDADDLNFLKMKLWALDGPLSPTEEEEDETDQDVTNPRNHWAWVQNELVFLDRYVRTQDDGLERNDEGEIVERNFDELVSDRIAAFEAWVATPRYPDDPENDELCQDWEQDYMSRPTRLETGDFASLYASYHAARAQDGFSSAFDITALVTGYCIDHQARAQDSGIRGYITGDDGEPLDSISNPTPGAPTPAEHMASGIASKASEMQDDRDRNHVAEMQRYWDEMWLAVTDCVAGVAVEDPPIPGGSGNAWSDAVVTNFPLRRPQVVLEAGHPSHAGIIAGGGGFLYPVLDPGLPGEEASYEMQYVDTNAGTLLLPAAASVQYPGRVTLTDTTVHPNFLGQQDLDHLNSDARDLPARDPESEDDGARFWEYVYFSVVNVVPGSGDPYTLVQSLTLGVTLMSLPDSPGTEYDRYDGYEANGGVLMSRQRFLELNSRLVNVNRLREDNAMGMGTRVPLESMSNVVLPDMEGDMLDALADRLDQKLSYTETLAEYCDEWARE